jgi:hypothetical protein
MMSRSSNVTPKAGVSGEYRPKQMSTNADISQPWTSIMTEIPTTGSRGQPLKMAQYIAEGRRLVALVNAYRAAKAEASPVSQPDPVDGEPSPAPTKKKKSWPLPPLDRPSEIPGFPLCDPAQDGEAISGLAKDIPDYGNIGRVKAIRATQAARRGKRAPLTPSGPSELRKKGRGRP